MSVQVTIRLTDREAAELDAAVVAGRHATRTEAIRAALALLTTAERERRIDEAIVSGYRRLPPTPAEVAWADAAGRQLIAEEPW